MEGNFSGLNSRVFSSMGCIDIHFLAFIKMERLRSRECMHSLFVQIKWPFNDSLKPRLLSFP